MVVMNANDSERTLKTAPFAENLKGFTQGKDAVTEKKFEDLTQIIIPPWESLILILK
jgi:hypothetical protein